MCRHIAYIGKNKTLSNVLLKHKHSLIEMAYKPKEMSEAVLNADGFGIAWKKNKNINAYKSDLPIWNDLNLISVTENISSSLIIANVRSATISSNLGYANTHPFHNKNIFFSHNGYIKNFNANFKYYIHNHLNKKYLSNIKGNTDSEYFFYLIIQMAKKYNNLKKGIKEACSFIKKSGATALINILLACFDNKGNKTLYASRLGIKSKAPSLYYNYIKNTGYFVSSEKLNSDKWLKIKDNQILEIKNNSLVCTKIF